MTAPAYPLWPDVVESFTRNVKHLRMSQLIRILCTDEGLAELANSTENRNDSETWLNSFEISNRVGELHAIVARYVDDWFAPVITIQQPPANAQFEKQLRERIAAMQGGRETRIAMLLDTESVD